MQLHKHIPEQEWISDSVAEWDSDDNHWPYKSDWITRKLANDLPTEIFDA